ncbi:MAG: metallophosphoesterase [Brumimicrobium sp.]|nr:metallophosphoesterase [Brumimicrobium sp.]
MSYRYIIAFSTIIGILIILDVYTWYGIKKTLGEKYLRFAKWFIPSTTFLFIFGFAINLLRGEYGIHNAHYLINLITGFAFGVFIAKLLIITPFFIEDITRLTIWVFRKINRGRKSEVKIPGRRKFVRNIAFSLAAIPISGAIYAITRGKYNFQIKKIPLDFPNLPDSFKRLKIVQFSDFHAGSFDDQEAVKEGLHLIMDQKPDLILFTGDLVNNRAVEAEPYLQMLADLSAPLGKFAILGNHDYGEYMSFESAEAKNENMNRLESNFERSGFNLLRNQHVVLTKNNESVNLVGVENWGKAPFPQYGDLDKATAGMKSDKFTILMSHDPDHWEYEARFHPQNFDLTLSGHTHGAQFGVEIPGWQWSPVKYRYKRWLGLYSEGRQRLFVSKGFGFLGFPGRLGMSPEIIVFELDNEI